MSVDGFSVANQSHEPVETTFIINFFFFPFGILKVIQAGVGCIWLVLLWLFFPVYSFAEIGNTSV